MQLEEHPLSLVTHTSKFTKERRDQEDTSAVSSLGSELAKPLNLWRVSLFIINKSRNVNFHLVDNLIQITLTKIIIRSS